MHIFHIHPKRATAIVTATLIFAATITFSDGLSGSTSNTITNTVKYSSNFAQSRPQMLDLLNHPLQLQLATGDLPLGSFQRLLEDRLVLVKGIQAATTTRDGASLLSFVGDDDTIIEAHHEYAKQALEIAKGRGKTIAAGPGIACYTCGGDHLNIDCPDDQEPSQSVLALSSVLQSSGLVGASAVLEAYSFACRQMLEAIKTSNTNNDGENENYDSVYHGWLEAHADQWSTLSDQCQEQMNQRSDSDFASYTTCLSMLYNWIDMEAAMTGIRADILKDSNITSLMETLEQLEPGYAAQRDKHSSFVADAIAPTSTAASSKVNAAAAYLAAKKKKEAEK